MSGSDWSCHCALESVPCVLCSSSPPAFSCGGSDAQLPRPLVLDSTSLMRVYWKPFLILSPGAGCQCRGSPVPRSQWRTVTDHSGHWWPWHSAAEASLGAGDFGHCVQELCFVFCYLATHGKNIHLSSKWLCWLGITEWRIKIMSSCWFDCVSDEMLLCSHSPVGGAGHNGAMSIRRIIYNWFFIVIVP